MGYHPLLRPGRGGTLEWPPRAQPRCIRSTQTSLREGETSDGKCRNFSLIGHGSALFCRCTPRLDFISTSEFFFDRVTALLIPHGFDVEPESGESTLASQESGRSRWVSLTFEDLAVLAPWLDSHIKMRIYGTELGHI